MPEMISHELETPPISFPQGPRPPGPDAQKAIARRWRSVRRRERLATISHAALIAGGVLAGMWGLKILFLRLLFLIG